jgi:porphobilinogen deaminase
LAGGCLAPIGGWARDAADGRLILGACVLEIGGDTVHRVAAEASTAIRAEGRRAVSAEAEARDEAEALGAADALGRHVAALLLAQGADLMLARMRSGATES